jgi:hypothetical protein
MITEKEERLMPTPPVQKVGRLAMREEGKLWCAYYAEPGTMKGAIFLGSIRLAFVLRDPQRKSAFMNLMRDGVADILEDATGLRPTWPEGPQAAPEHERGGRG